MNRNMVLGGALVLICAGITMGSLPGSKRSSVTFENLPQQKAGEKCEVYGKLDAASIRSLKGANMVHFELVEEKTNRRLNVLYDRPDAGLPANFPAASHAKVSGVYDAAAGQLVADAVQTKCPSKYDKGSPELTVEKQKAVDKWRRDIGAASDKT